MQITWLFLLVLISPAGLAQRPVGSPENPLVVSDLSGVVEDTSGGPIGQARADLLDCSTKQITKRSLADAQGGFLLTPGWDSADYCLRFSMEGFRPVEVRVKLEKSAAKLVVQLPSTDRSADRSDDASIIHTRN